MQIKGQLRKSNLIIGGLVILGIITALIVFSVMTNRTCQELKTRGQTTEARVLNIGLYKNKPGYQRAGRNVPADTLAEAIELRIKISYTVNGTTYGHTISSAYYEKHDELEKLYYAAKTGTITVRYLPNNPSEVRFESEFLPGAPTSLCTESGIRNE